MKASRYFYILAAILSVLGAVSAHAAPKSVSNLTAVATDGISVDITAQPGWKVVYFWSATCPCVRACEKYSFLPLAEKYKGQVQFYAVVSGGYELGQSKATLAKEIATHHLPYPVLLDPKHELVQTLEAKITPQAFLIDPQNRVVFDGVPDDSRRYEDKMGYAGYSQSYLGKAIVQSMAGKPVTQPTVEDVGCVIGY